MTDEEFHVELMQMVAARGAATADFSVAAFTELVAEALVDSGSIQEFVPLPFKSPNGSIRIEGYGFADEGLTLDLLVAEFDGGEEVQTLTRTAMEPCFRRVEKFLLQAPRPAFRDTIDVSHPAWGFARQLADQLPGVSRVRFHLLTDEVLSSAVKEIPSEQDDGRELTYRVWDLRAIQRLMASAEPEEIEIDLVEMFGESLPCLAANAGGEGSDSYLTVIPGAWLAAIYDRWSGRLLEQNVRTFLQAKGKVNKGIRKTILDEPDLFFAFNNGISATASEAGFVEQDGALRLTKLRHLQIVNGGQTTASIFNVMKKDKGVNLDRIRVQMKLSVIKPELVDQMVPRISQYANSQNKVSDADFFSNHPFHVRIEGISRRLWAPAPEGVLTQTHWFYERARGQYANACAWLTPAKRREFDLQNPRGQVMTKTDLARVVMTFRGQPHTVCHGSQKNFMQFAEFVADSWKDEGIDFGDAWFRTSVAETIIFRSLEKAVQKADWYSQGYRAQIVTYSIALMQYHLGRIGQVLDFERIWQRQSPSPELVRALLDIGERVNRRIVEAAAAYGIANVTEWCKRERCWEDLKSKIDTSVCGELDIDLVSTNIASSGLRNARKEQKVTNEIEAQADVVRRGAAYWQLLLKWSESGTLMTPSELDVLRVASRMPKMIPTGHQSIRLLQVVTKAIDEGWSA
ncbi:AIPR family protein [Curvibacter sp. CHRR-16]|uniref:AIPR family protein n=1 Tax=Curvibacter sp. CHRR-16 TaxID=2835872 RepID=UPI001BDB48ED|nr:AIPR family protein [Curvibacter sp. CHRR-16]MBT0570298.1 AIPR family protein [Curvibacter sp. CHRR-16]